MPCATASSCPPRHTRERVREPRGCRAADAARGRARLRAESACAASRLRRDSPIYVPFTPGSVKGVLYKPDSGPAPHVAVLLIHRTSNFLAHLATTELASRGFMVLAMNPRSDNNEAAVSFEDNALDIKSGIEFLRRQPGITRVLLFGHSGGGPATSFYQAVAETGPCVLPGAEQDRGVLQHTGGPAEGRRPDSRGRPSRCVGERPAQPQRCGARREGIRARSIPRSIRSARPTATTRRRAALFRRVQAEVFQGAGRSR